MIDKREFEGELVRANGAPIFCHGRHTCCRAGTRHIDRESMTVPIEQDVCRLQ